MFTQSENLKVLTEFNLFSRSEVNVAFIMTIKRRIIKEFQYYSKHVGYVPGIIIEMSATTSQND